jgi:hypothetical protein
MPKESMKKSVRLQRQLYEFWWRKECESCE